MKKILLSLSLIAVCSLSSLSFATSLTNNPNGIASSELSTAENNKILQKWFKDNQIQGKKITNEQEAKNLANFPDTFKSFKVRVIKHNSVVTMDFSSSRINFVLDENEKIVQVSVG